MDCTIHPNDLFIAVMGVTGAGKSTFIARNTKEEYYGGSDELISCNSRISIHTAIYEGRTVHFVDTPGFDDSTRSDGEILQEIAYWLIAAWEREIKLSGIIYLHRITDTRLYGSALRSLNAFKEMCGKAAFPNIVIATTMWDTLNPNEVAGAVKRHEEFHQKACQDLIDGGGKLLALSAVEVDSAKIVQHLVQRNRRFNLALQQELMVEGKLLHETRPGKILFGASSKYVETLNNLIAKSYELKSGLVENANQKDETELAHVLRTLKTQGELMEQGIEQAMIAKTDIKRVWEEKLRSDDAALEKAIANSETCLESMDTSILEEDSKKALQILAAPTTRTLVTTKDALSTSRQEMEAETSEDSQLMMRHRRLEVISTQRLNRRRTASRHIAPRMGLIGTGLAVAQIVATLACVVM